MRTNQIVIAIAIVFITGLIISCSLSLKEESNVIVVNIPDQNFEALIREVLEIPTRDITNQDLWTIKNLNGVGRNIYDISGIEHCSGLQILIIRHNDIINIEPLAELVLLNQIDLEDNQISDIKPLVENPGIGIGDDNLYLINNPLSDISILQYKPLIQKRGVKVYSNALPSSPGILNIVDQNFETILREHLGQPIGDIINTDLEAITTINAQNRNISNIYGIEFCVNLNILDISGNSISDLLPLSNLKQLTFLNLNNNNITDIEPLNGLDSLTNLYLNNNTIGSINALTNLIKITTLFLNNTNIQDISPLSNLLNLKYLAISGNPIIDLGPVTRIDSINAFELMNLNQFDFNDINNIKNLQTLYLTNTPITNLDSIARHKNLKALLMDNCNLSDIDSLADLTALQKLILNDNYVTDITALSELHELSELQLNNNLISDIQPLVNNWGLNGASDYVLLYNNPLSNISINTYIPQLKNRGVHVFY